MNEQEVRRRMKKAINESEIRVDEHWLIDDPEEKQPFGVESPIPHCRKILSKKGAWDSR